MLTLLNPAEFVRVFSIMRMGAGSAFGADYYEWVNWETDSYGMFIFLSVFISWIVILIFISSFIWRRGEVNDSK